MVDRRVDFQFCLLVGIMAAFGSGCGNETPSPGDASTPIEPDAPVCASPGDTFSVGIAKTSTEGLTVAIEDANPAPPGIGKMSGGCAYKTPRAARSQALP